ncbi:hypothetical protein D9M72_341740 [compost metagenome]
MRSSSRLGTLSSAAPISASSLSQRAWRAVSVATSLKVSKRATKRPTSMAAMAALPVSARSI